MSSQGGNWLDRLNLGPLSMGWWTYQSTKRETRRATRKETNKLSDLTKMRLKEDAQDASCKPLEEK